MRIGVNLINFGPGAEPAALGRWARVVEDLGYHLLMTSDHIAITPDVAARCPAHHGYVPIGWPPRGRPRPVGLIAEQPIRP